METEGVIGEKAMGDNQKYPINSWLFLKVLPTSLLACLNAFADKQQARDFGLPTSTFQFL